MKNRSRQSVELGIEVYQINHIEKACKLTFDFIVFEVEYMHLSHLEAGRSINLKDFFKVLFETFPDKRVLVQLPRPETINRHFIINQHQMISGPNFARFNYFYFEIISAISAYHHRYVSIIIPELENVEDYNDIRYYITQFFRISQYPNVGIGLGIDTVETFYNHKEFQKFDYAIIELEKIFYELYDNPNEEGAKYLKDLLQFKYELRRRDKPLLVRGEVLHRFDEFQELLASGFKHFVVDECKIDIYNKMIKDYENKVNQKSILHK